MINFQITPLLTAIKIMGEYVVCGIANKNRILSSHEREILSNKIEFIQKLCRELALPSTYRHLDNIFGGIKSSSMDYSWLSDEIARLSEAIHYDIQFEVFYHYRKDKRLTLLKAEAEWAPTIRKFPSSKDDIVCGVDCWALEKYNASAYHFMMVLEHGLKALAIDVGCYNDNQNWQNIIEKIESKIKSEREKPKYEHKTDRMEFLSIAAKEFFYFKDGWRNHIAHNRAKYDEEQSLSFMIHVRSFMNHIATRLSE